MRCFIGLFIGIIAWGLSATAQSGFSVKGKVQDEKGHPLPFASAFLNQTTMGDRTTEAGDFTIRRVPAGKYEMIVSYLGYEPVVIPITVAGDVSGVVVTMKAKPGVLKEVVIRRNPEREKWMRTFKEVFIGMGVNADKCRILNDELINLEYDAAKNTLTASSDDFIVVDNNALGYRVKFLLMNFLYDMRSGYSVYYGNPLFELMKPRNRKEEARWIKKREKAYHGSTMHFYRSLIHKKLEEDGFEVRKLVRKERQRGFVPPETLGDSAAVAKIQKPEMFSRYVSYLFNEKLPYDSIFYKNDSSYVMRFKDFLHVIYTKEKEEKRYAEYIRHDRSGKTIQQTSLLRLLAPEVRLDINGNVESPMDVIVEQYWGWEKMADMLPLDYKL